MATLSKFDAQHARRRDGHEQEVGIAENYLQGFHEGVSGLMGGARLSEAVIGLPQHLQLARLVFRFVLCCARRYAQRGMQKVAADVAPARERDAGPAPALLPTAHSAPPGCRTARSRR